MKVKEFLKEHRIVLSQIVVATLLLGAVLVKYYTEVPQKAETGDSKVETVCDEQIYSSVKNVPYVEPEVEETAEKYTEMTVTATAYCACEKCCGKSDGITATGTKATAGRTIAVDPKVIPYGSEVIINGNVYIAEDTGGAIKGNKVDIYFNSHDAARKFGVQKMTAFIKEDRGK